MDVSAAVDVNSGYMATISDKIPDRFTVKLHRNSALRNIAGRVAEIGTAAIYNITKHGNLGVSGVKTGDRSESFGATGHSFIVRALNGPTRTILAQVECSASRKAVATYISSRHIF